jgi:peptidoglycan hydrolase-like protein with peptidoglycan-binding domain
MNRPLRTPRAPLLALAAMLLTACATTSLASAPPTERPATVPTTAARPTTTLAATTTTTTTVAPSTVALPTTTTTIPATTTTTVDPYHSPPPAVPIVAVGSSDGAETERAQWRLVQLGFWLQEVNGDYGLTTRQAVMAFQKYHGLSADGVLGEETAAVLSSVTERPRARSDAGTLVEIDKAKQLIYFVNEGFTTWVLNTSTGSEIPYDEPDKNTPGERQIGDSVTRNGLHWVYRERAEGWWEGDLGEIYRPKYFSGGEAVHGSNSIPNYPASHGCVRVSVPAMDWIWDNNLMPMDIPVWVHGAIPSSPL